MNNISSSKMKTVREAYGLQPSGMDLICGFEVGLWDKYEKGQAQSPPDAHLIGFATSPMWMLEMMNRYSETTIYCIAGWKKALRTVQKMVVEIERKGDELKEQLNKSYFDDFEILKTDIINLIYKRKQLVPDVLAAKWDGKDETAKLIRDEICSKVSGITAKKSGDVLEIYTIDGSHTTGICAYLGDYVVYDVLDKWSFFIRAYPEETFHDYYEKREE